MVYSFSGNTLGVEWLGSKKEKNKATRCCLEIRKLNGSKGNGKEGVGGIQKKETKWNVGMDVGMDEG